MKHAYTISFNNILLRPLAFEDISDLRIWRNDPENSKYIRKIPFITEEMQELWFKNYLQDSLEITLAIEYDKSFVGSVSLYDIQETSAVFGKLMVGRQKGKGIGRQATLACLKLAFSQLGLTEIQAEVSVDNTAALIIYIDAGFRIVQRRYNEAIGLDEYVIRIDKKRFEALHHKKD